MFISFSVFVVVQKYPYLHNNFPDFYALFLSSIQTFWTNIAFCKALEEDTKLKEPKHFCENLPKVKWLSL